MTLGVILAVVDGGAGSEAVVTAALSLGRGFGAHVELLHVEAEARDAMPVLGESISGAMVQQTIDTLVADAKHRAAEAERLYARHCVAAGLALTDEGASPAAGSFTVGFNHVLGREADEVSRRGRLVDLVIVARPAPDADSGYSPALEAGMFETGRPVLMVPPSLPESFAGRIAVAWNGSREASRAAAAVVPILRKAEQVVVLTAQDGWVGAKPSEMARYLGHHGIEAKTWAFTPGSGAVGGALLNQAAEAGAGSLVMGAYGHSRLRELVLGGATRSVVASAEIPVFMAH